ncbi:MAG TPA: VOC family protein [Candidatus Baltobacteraceae bacterium]|nr:VOC family protein [Candidatus Baltobacteraceae bacterium]
MSTTAEAGSVRVTGIDLTGYMTKDAPRAIAFYRDVLGMEPTVVYPGDAGAEFTLPGGETFGLWNPGDTMPFQTASSALFAVPSVENAVKALEARGITVLMNNESPVCYMAMIADPDGNMVILHQRKPGND